MKSLSAKAIGLNWSLPMVTVPLRQMLEAVDAGSDAILDKYIARRRCQQESKGGARIP